MRIHRGILAAFALAAGAAAHASVDMDCVRVELDPAGTVCAGTLAQMDVTVANACDDTKHVAVTFSLDRDPLRAQTASIVPAEEQLRKTVVLEIPDTTPPGTHTLTMTTRDIEGNANSMSVRLSVRRCATAGS